MTTENFAFLDHHDAQLGRLASLAERYFPDDPNTCLIKLRQFAELLAQRCCQSNANRSPKSVNSGFSGSKLTPLGQSGRAVQLEGIAATEMAVFVEVIVDRGMSGGELLKGLHVPEFRHRALSSSKRLV